MKQRRDEWGAPGAADGFDIWAIRPMRYILLRYKSTNRSAGKMEQTLTQLEEESLFEDDHSQVPPSDIVAYNELRSCADLFRMHQQKILTISPEFQRDVVWKGPDQTRFVDSLIKQLPIPSMCFALDHKAQKWLVIDGLQRISTIIRFLEGADWKLSPLEDVEPEIAGKSVAAIKPEASPLHHYYTRVENLSVPITVLRCDFKKKSHMEYLFTIFHRLNTGGMKLNNQEIRNCIFGGTFNALLKELDGNSTWRRLNKMRKGESYRFTKQEIILRAFAFADKLDSYEGHLSKFLNVYMHSNQNPSEDFLSLKRSAFNSAMECVSRSLLANKSIQKLSLTVLEATMVGILTNIDLLKSASPDVIQSRFEQMSGHEEFSESALKEGLAKKPRVIARLKTAIKIFAGK